MALKIDVKFQGKLTCLIYPDFKNDLRDLPSFYRLKNSKTKSK